MHKKTKLGFLGLIVIAAVLGGLYGLFKGEGGYAQVLTARQSLNRKLVFNIKTGQWVNKNEAYAAGLPSISWRGVDHKWRGGRSSWLTGRNYDYVVSLSVANMDMEFAPTKDNGSLLRDYWNDGDDGNWPEVPQRKTAFYVWTVGPEKFNHPILFRTFDGTAGMLKIVRVERPNRVHMRYKYVSSTRPPLAQTSETNGRFAVTLPNGAKIEVMGISRCPSAGQAWWKPDGQMLDRAPYINKRKAFRRSREGRTAYEIAWRGGSRRRVRGSVGSGSVAAEDEFGNRLWEVDGTATLFEGEPDSTTIDFAATVGDWQTVLATRQGGEKQQVNSKIVSISPPAVDDKGRLVIDLTFSAAWERDCATRFVAVDRDGKIHDLDRYLADVTDIGHTAPDSDMLTQHTFTIDDLPLGVIQQWRFEFRPLQWVKFKNVSLVPGKDFGFEIEVQELQVEDLELAKEGSE